MAHGRSDRSGDRAGGDRGGENAGPPPPGPPRRAGEAGAHHALIRLATHDSSRTQPADRRRQKAPSLGLGSPRSAISGLRSLGSLWGWGGRGERGGWGAWGIRAPLGPRNPD